MATDFPSAGSPSGTPVSAGAIASPSGHVAVALGSDQAVSIDRTAGARFDHATCRVEAYRTLVEHLDQFPGVVAVVHVTAPGLESGPVVNQLRFTLQGRQAEIQQKQLLSVCYQSMQSRQTHWRRQLSPERIIIAVPVSADPTQSEAVGIIATSPDNVPSFVAEVEKMVGQFTLWQVRQIAKQESDIASNAAATVELVTKVLEANDLRDACQVIVTELSDHLNLRQAAIGLYRNRKTGCRLTAMSDSTRIDATTDQTRLLENVMDEALLLGKTVVAGQGQRDQATANNANELARQNSGVVLAIPLIDQAALLMILEQDASIDSIIRFLDAMQPSLVAALAALDQSWAPKVARHAIAASRSRKGLISLAAVSLMIATMFLPIRHRETCDVRVEPSIKRFVAAPFDATLKECYVAPGDLVTKGQPLAMLDGRELTWQRDALQADHDQAIKKRDAAQASRAYADQRIAELEIDSIRSELNLLNHRLSELELRSPIDGIVVAGDLNRATGTPLTTGQSLFEIAPLDEMMIEVSVADDQISRIHVDQTAQLRLNAYPDRNWETSVTLINPRSEIRDEDNVFIAQCDLPNPEHLLRPGMRGTVKITCGRRALGWILFHRPVESVTQWLWW